jgi:DNA repair protein RecO
MSEIFKTKGLVLRKTSALEWDNFYEILTKNYGRLSFFAKSARKLKAKLAPHLEPGSFVRLEFAPRYTSDSYFLTGASLIFRPSFSKNSAALNLLILKDLELTERILSPATTEATLFSKTFSLAQKYFTKLNPEELKNKRIILLRINYFLKLLHFSGLLLDFKKCLFCGKKLTKTDCIFYQPEEGGFICCKKDGFPVSFDSLKLLNFLAQISFLETEKLKIDSKTKKEAWKIIYNHLQYCLE